ncbi:hypothetical protein HPB50_022216 [Hyalomma asiaticum]|uniref:Uncharacterized protein n=1 Tax=Hyalomma asiaticum TaxID=266040 RepID=A0ACB7SAL2_HYAAI|nr:hypothetical protein HPB50_022216 [Hyalomma asiaticum]
MHDRCAIETRPSVPVPLPATIVPCPVLPPTAAATTSATMAAVDTKALDGPSVTLTVRLIMQGKVRLADRHSPVPPPIVFADEKQRAVEEAVAPPEELPPAVRGSPPARRQPESLTPRAAILLSG